MVEMKKLRLLLTKECHRNCEGCCNKNWDLASLPVCTSFQDYEEIMLTGGEPMSNPILIEFTMIRIYEENPQAKIYLYTADLRKVEWVYYLLEKLHGINVTLHEQSDVDDFIIFNSLLSLETKYFKSLRLNVFEGVDISTLDEQDLRGWKVRRNLKWIKDCPLPKDEVFMRLK